jgi:hypothetical protein
MAHDADAAAKAHARATVSFKAVDMAAISAAKAASSLAPEQRDSALARLRARAPSRV